MSDSIALTRHADQVLRKLSTVGTTGMPELTEDEGHTAAALRAAGLWTSEGLTPKGWAYFDARSSSLFVWECPAEGPQARRVPNVDRINAFLWGIDPHLRATQPRPSTTEPRQPNPAAYVRVHDSCGTRTKADARALRWQVCGMVAERTDVWAQVRPIDATTVGVVVLYLGDASPDRVCEVLA